MRRNGCGFSSSSSFKSGAGFPVPEIDLRALPPAAREARLAGYWAEFSERGFDAQAPSWFRVELVLLGDRDHALLCNLHHAMGDGWSLDILLRELAALYTAGTEGKPSPLPDLPLQYADYAAWQRTGDPTRLYRAQTDYWKRQLTGLPPLLALPSDRPRPAVPSYRGAVHAFAIAPPWVEALKDLGRRRQATLFMTVASLYAVLLGRHANQQDVAIGTPIAGRNRQEVEGLVGYFLNTLVLRAQIDPDQSFLELLASVQRTCLDAYAHQDVPFESLVSEIRPERNLAHSPIFQAFLVLGNTANEELRLPGLRAAPLPGARTTAKFDLTLSLEETHGELRGHFEYNTDLFDAETIARLAGRFERLLQAVVADPDKAIADVALAGEDERSVVVGETVACAPTTVAAWFEAQAQRTPQAVAVWSEAGSLSYGELGARSERLAGEL